MIAEGVAKLGIGKAILVVHSWAGALVRGWRWISASGLRSRDAGGRWPSMAGRRRTLQQDRGDAGDRAAFAYTITLPLGVLLVAPGARGVFFPQTNAGRLISDTATMLLLRAARSRQCDDSGGA